MILHSFVYNSTVISLVAGCGCGALIAYGAVYKAPKVVLGTSLLLAGRFGSSALKSGAPMHVGIAGLSIIAAFLAYQNTGGNKARTD
jgi:hypothetical protein